MDSSIWYWILIFGGAFVIGEIYAIRTKKKGDTLSENVHDLTNRIPYGGYLLAALMAWLAWHFTAGKGTEWDFWNRTEKEVTNDKAE